MRLSIALLFIALLSCETKAQILDPSHWSFKVSNKNVKAGDEIEITFSAEVDENWYVYSNDFDPDCGPLLTEVEFEDIKNFTLVGGLLPINPTPKYEEAFGCDVKIFKHHAEFKQKIRVLGPVKISGAIKGQVCTSVDFKCVSFDKSFSFDDIKVTGTASGKNTDSKTSKPEEIKTPEQSSVTPAISNPPASDTSTTASTSQEKIEPQKNKGPILDKTILDGEADQEEQSLIGYIFFAFLLGLASLITPCVFPMIPMTITFFLKDNQSKREGIRKAFIFGISIILIYTVVGTLFAVVLGADGLNALATHWIPNLLISAIFIVFALSFLGLFEINAPYQLVNKTDRASEKGGLVGIFFMSATLVLVSFSCTLPLVGNVLVMAAGGQFIKPVAGMLAYSFAYALPFALFAFFPEWLKGLPKSGGWLNSVKVTLGLFELALAFKFFSIADLSYQWGILDRDINIAIWIVIFGILGFYLLGKIRFPNDSPMEKVGIPRLMLAIATFSFVVYLIPGLWGAPLKALAGYLPPMYTHDFNLVEKLEKLDASENNKQEICSEPKYSEMLHLPHGLKGYFDYDQAIACARQQNKPLFIDFTGHGCTNCREMEANVWANPEVLKRLKEDFVVVALYVDDKTELPESAWYTSSYDNKVKKTIGKQNADLQIRNLQNNAQPFYVLVGKDERVLAWPKAYDKSVENFIDFLESGKKTYRRLYLNSGSNL
jgi:thiol:disulfide interchange protein